MFLWRHLESHLWVICVFVSCMRSALNASQPESHLIHLLRLFRTPRSLPVEDEIRSSALGRPRHPVIETLFNMQQINEDTNSIKVQTGASSRPVVSYVFCIGPTAPGSLRGSSFEGNRRHRNNASVWYDIICLLMAKSALWQRLPLTDSTL